MMLNRDANASSWLSRCRRALVPFAGAQVVSAGSGSGINFIIAGLRTSRLKAIWVELDERDIDDSVSVANKLSDAIEEQFGARLFGQGIPLVHAVARLEGLHELLGPYTIVVGNANLNIDAVATVAGLSEYGSNVILVEPGATEHLAIAAHVQRRVAEDVFALSDDEAIQLSAGSVPPEVAVAENAAVNGRFLDFMNSVRALSGEPPVLEPEATGFSIFGSGVGEVPFDLLVASLRRKGALVDAFEVCARIRPERCSELIDEAGPRFAMAGLHERLYAILGSLRLEVLESSDQLMRWYFSSATSVGQHRAVRPMVQKYLMEHEAPELRALYASAFPDADLLSQTARAVAALATPLTLRMHGFALGHAEHGEAGLAYLQKALRMAEAFADVDQVVGAATDICNFHVRRGNYREAREWIQWALQQYVAGDCRDELRRIAAVSLLAYTRLLTEQAIGIDALIPEIDLPDGMAGLPTTETAISTVGDWHFLKGSFGEAEQRYRQNLDAMPRSQLAFFVPDVIPALLRLGRTDEAASLGQRVRALTASSDAVSRALGLLASGLSLVDSDPDRAMSELEESQDMLAGNLEAQRLAQASIALSGLRLRRGDASGSMAALQKGAPGIRQLGFVGWRLLGGVLAEDEIRTLWRKFNRVEQELELEFLGSRSVLLRNSAAAISFRHAECVAVLASNPQGLTGEQLATALYGDDAVSGTMKALISRLRGTIPVESRPYRLAVPYRADFLELIELLKRGHVRQALNLYKGPLLPESESPAVVELRDHIDESLRQAVLESGDAEAMIELANRTGTEDLELLETALEFVPQNDPQSPLLRARIRQVRRDWEADGAERADRVNRPRRTRRSGER